MFNRDDVVRVKDMADFNVMDHEDLCRVSNDDIIFKDTHCVFTKDMRKFCGHDFLVFKYVDDAEIYLYTDEDGMSDVMRYTFSSDMLDAVDYDSDAWSDIEEDEEYEESLKTECTCGGNCACRDTLDTNDYLNLISSVNNEYYNLLEIIKDSSKLSSDCYAYLFDRVKYLEKLKEKLCVKMIG